jgi:diguanylate cyclase
LNYPRGSLMALPKICWITGFAAAALIVIAVWLLAGWGGDATTRAVSDVGSVAFGLFALVCAGIAAWSGRGRDRGAWICLMIGLAGWFVGDAIWAHYELWRRVPGPFPSVADGAYLVFPVLACLALVLFPIGYSGQSQIRLVLDGLIVTGSLFVVSWVSVLRTVYTARGTRHFALGLALAYPVSDWVTITVAVLVLARTHTGQRATMTLLTAGIAAIALSDSGFVYLIAHNDYVSGSVIDLGWLAGLLLLGVAALVRVRTLETGLGAARVLPRVALWLPYVPLLLASVVGTVYLLPSPGSAPVLGVSLLLVGAVLVRQFLVVGENQRLLVTVADQALRDPLTGLANRVLFHDRLTHAVQLRDRDPRAVAVLSLDLDHFKLVNDSLGHPAGDAMLIGVAERILGCVRTGDTVARLGGDEFAILIEDGADPPAVVAHRVVTIFDGPFTIDGQELLIRPSVGLAVASAEDPGVSADELLKQADVAMYSAKRARTGGVHTFTPDMHLIDLNELNLPREPSVTTERGGAVGMQLLGQLRRAIDHGELSMVYQPKFELRTGDIVGVEALVRWPHPERGLLEPDHFLPLVRENGLMRAVTEVVLAQALGDAAQWHDRGVGIPVAVNLFAPSLGDLELPSRIAQALADRELTSDALTVEVAEDLLLGNIGRTRMVLHRLRECGIRIAIDDFGGGYSALRNLCELPIDEVKLDRQFIAPILHNRRAAAIVRAVIDLVHTLRMTSVAEGVENLRTATRLEEYGCDFAQGHYYSPPVAAPALLHLLSNQVARPKGFEPHRRRPRRLHRGTTP